LIMESRWIAGMLDDTIKTAQATAERFGIDGAEDTLSDKAEVIRAAISIALYCYYRVPFAVCCDGQVLEPCSPIKDCGRVVGLVPNSHWIFEQVAEARKAQLGGDAVALRPQGKHWEQYPASPGFQDVLAAAAGVGVFTLASWFQKTEVAPAPPTLSSSWESIDDMIDQDPVLKKAKEAAAGESMSRSDVRLGACVAAQCDPPVAGRQLYGQVLNWVDEAYLRTG
jgi:hypothetical protein